MTTPSKQPGFLSRELDKFVIRTRAAKRLLMWRYCSGSLPLYLVPEFPKSGGTWFSQMLATALEVPFYRNTTPQKFCSSVMSGHHLYHPNFKNVTVVFRDGRDAIVSAYFYFLFKNEINRHFAVARHRSFCAFDDYDDTVANMPRFIEYMFTEFAHGRHFSWADFVDSWLGRISDYVRYEDLLTEPAAVLRKHVLRLTGRELELSQAEKIVEDFSFKRQSGRSPGTSNTRSFVRKGIAGDWKNHFNAEAREVFDHFAGQQLIQLGYEKDRSWVSNTTLENESKSINQQAI